MPAEKNTGFKGRQQGGLNILVVRGGLVAPASGGVIPAVKRDTASYLYRYAGRLAATDPSGGRPVCCLLGSPGTRLISEAEQRIHFRTFLRLMDRVWVTHLRKAHVERRDSPRYEIEVPLTFSGNAIAGSGLVTSLSNEGCHVVSEESLPARACLSLHVEFPAPYEPMTVEVAEVRWTNATGFGLVFVHVHDEEHARLQRFIDWLKRTHNN